MKTTNTIEGAGGQKVTVTFDSGFAPNNICPDTKWQAFDTHMNNVGEVFTISGADVNAEIDRAMDIKHHEPKDLATRFARRNIPNAVGVVGVYT